MIYIPMPETLDVSYGQEVKVFYNSREVEATIVDGACFPAPTENDIDTFTIKYLVEFKNKERKWMPMGDIEVIKDEGNDN
jgi:hypothetical protein